MNILVLLFSITPPNDFQQFLLWGFGGLVSVALFMGKLYLSQLKKIEEMYIAQSKSDKENFKERLDYKQSIIDQLTGKYDDLTKSYEKMITEITPTIKAGNSALNNVLETLRNDRP